MEAPWPHGGLWGLALLPPTLLLAALCARCRRPRGHGAHVDNYDYKPPPCVSPTRFKVIPPHRYPSQALLHPQQPPPWGGPAETLRQLPSPQPPQSRRVSIAHPEPGPRDPPTPPEGDDDYSNEPYATGYVEVLPDPATQDGTPPGGRGGAEGGDRPHGHPCPPRVPPPATPPGSPDPSPAAAPSEEYENVPEGARGSLADSLEYINVPPAGSSPRDASESEDCGPDYENL